MSQATRPIVGREILQKRVGKTMALYVPEWDGEIILRQFSHTQVVYVQSLATGAVDMDKQSIRDTSALTRFNFAMIRNAWVDEAGNPVLSDDDFDDTMAQPNSVIKLIVSTVAEFNDMNENAKAAAKVHSDTKKNLAVTTNGASGTN